MKWTLVLPQEVRMSYYKKLWILLSLVQLSSLSLISLRKEKTLFPNWLTSYSKIWILEIILKNLFHCGNFLSQCSFMNRQAILNQFDVSTIVWKIKYFKLSDAQSLILQYMCLVKHVKIFISSRLNFHYC